ncbi:similar to Saccharomyces cerevisiae YBR243C ALG7 UDP-N-acetyl-glucosamine-1-P transferase [Maudiozyma barnettii]|uniref:UDP-N-acetylglucosamine--dolichyl-phosphate N-acetylglucosaminephosphotransferase n=1 Tax=Maudiozyma barnettii TaxID=61262 RepID=A0A8H2ZJM1_9SACH|nr:UDP-N-acetylglucosamine--dolichyl-phosphate N-acetylglucosaminephosphotransferase [Kazachstania barnettii]CAB4256682.1 similar to Saccharomyces cerevisiae YBR243C ALG7 UDP-N-acetyl-glucosamine-1-P transferase [Kazachstania barnettii]CAD1785338.1 similar to Saccharomyces cerevisiae YBR243C ALG7 UDP-N-acetyl-glucosamine-1-P transferase [Kazachstania barnettii]
MLRKLLFLLASALIFYSRHSSVVVAAVGFSIIGYIVTDYLIPRVGPSFIKIGLFGKDLSKVGKPVLPECIGAVSATVYLFIMFFYIPFIFYRYLVTVTSGGGQRDVTVDQWPTDGPSYSVFPHSRLSEYLSSTLCLESTILLGIADDLFDIRWRHKFFLPAVAAIPLLAVYYIDFGVTSVLVPGFMQQWLNQCMTFLHEKGIVETPSNITSIDLKGLYYMYMASMAIFCPNSINILAGINGLEVGQSIVLGFLALINDTLYVTLGNETTKNSHIFSIVLIIPFLGVSMALFKWNKWPAKVFVGDTYCYFAGMVFAVVGIQGHFAKTMLLLFVPQIINFIYSVPQLFNLVFCPRHRLPKFNESDGLLYPSRANLKESPPKGFFVPILKVLGLCHLIDLEIDGKTGQIVSCSNMTIINLMLVWFGPMREDKLCNLILGCQFMIGFAALVLRHCVGSIIFQHDNLWTIK